MKVRIVKITIGLLLATAFLTLRAVLPVTDSKGEEKIVPVYSGVSLTIFEQTGSIFEYTYPVDSLMAAGEEFITGAGEKYTISSDGTYLVIRCFHHKSVLEEAKELYAGGTLSSLPFKERSGGSPGNNIVAARLNGVPGFPDGIWASSIIRYTLGPGGSAETTMSSLGDALIRGGEDERHCTSLGRGQSEVVFGFSPFVQVTVDAVPKILETVDDSMALYLELPEGQAAEDVDLSTVIISEASGSEVNISPQAWSLEIGDYDGDGLSDIKMEFDEKELGEYLLPGENPLTVTGRLYGGVSLRGVGSLTVQEAAP